MPKHVDGNDFARQEPLMWLNEDRVLYLGLNGVISQRTFGAYSIYVSLNCPHHVSVDGGSRERTWFSVIGPNIPYRIECGERMILSVLVEADTVSIKHLPWFIQTGCGAVDAKEDFLRIRNAFKQFGGVETPCLSTADFDECLFGKRLELREIDRRIRTIVERIKATPTEIITAQFCAEASALSASRFLHLFKEELGVSFRSFRAWHRARSVLYHVRRDTTLANVALDTGYPDSTHFSHSVRQVFGMTPKSMFAGSRKLSLHDLSGSARRQL